MRHDNSVIPESFKGINLNLADASEVTTLRGMSISDTALKNFTVPDENEFDAELTSSINELCEKLSIPGHLINERDRLIDAFKDYLLKNVKNDELYKFLIKEIRKVKEGSMRKEDFIQRWFNNHLPLITTHFEERAREMISISNALVVFSELPVEIINLRTRSYYIDLYVFRFLREIYVHAFRRARVYLNNLKRFRKEIEKSISIINDLLEIHEKMVKSRISLWFYLKLYNIEIKDLEKAEGKEMLQEVFKKIPMKAPIDDPDFEVLKNTFESVAFEASVSLSKVISSISNMTKSSISPSKVLEKIWLKPKLEPHVEYAFMELVLTEI